MDKSKLELKPHVFLSDTQTIEVWYNGEFIASVYGADGPGVRVVSKHPMDIVRGGMGELVNSIEVRVEVNKDG